MKISGAAMSTASRPMVSISGRERLRSPDARPGPVPAPGAAELAAAVRFEELAVPEVVVGVLT
jgi:hypothetical protein